MFFLRMQCYGAIAAIRGSNNHKYLAKSRFEFAYSHRTSRKGAPVEGVLTEPVYVMTACLAQGCRTAWSSFGLYAC